MRTPGYPRSLPVLDHHHREYPRRPRRVAVFANSGAEDVLLARNVIYTEAYQFWRDDAEYFCVPEAGGEADKYILRHVARPSGEKHSPRASKAES